MTAEDTDTPVRVSPLAGLHMRQLIWPVGVLTLLGLAAMLSEPALFLAINKACSQLPDVVWVALSLLGNGWVIAALLLPLVPRYPQLFFAALMTAPWTSLVAKGAKLLFSTPRPPGVLEAGSFNVIGEVHLQSSMPSGHTITAFAVAIALIRMPGSPFAKHAGKLLFVAALVGLSRMGMGVHWPEDVLIGAAIGGLTGLVAASLAHHLFPTHWLALPESGFPDIRGNGARAALVWSVIGLLPTIALFTFDEDRGLAPELRYALAGLALFYSLKMLWVAKKRW
jgi:membrane-associated phospholipid phosphatase